MLRNRKGFTLIELLIVVVIIGILAAIAIPRFGETRERAYVSAMQSDLNQLRNAMEMCLQDNTGADAYTYNGCDHTLIQPAGAAADAGATDGVTMAVNVVDAGAAFTALADHNATDRGCAYDSRIGRIGCDETGSAAALAALTPTP